LLSLSDTLAVINEGRLSKPMKVGDDTDIEEIGLLMGGVHGDVAPRQQAGARDEVAHAV
jgi:simple sugar transport system ATP-binding protein